MSNKIVAIWVNDPGHDAFSVQVIPEERAHKAVARYAAMSDKARSGFITKNECRRRSESIKEYLLDFTRSDLRDDNVLRSFCRRHGIQWKRRTNGSAAVFAAAHAWNRYHLERDLLQNDIPRALAA